MGFDRLQLDFDRLYVRPGAGPDFFLARFATAMPRPIFGFLLHFLSPSPQIANLTWLLLPAPLESEYFIFSPFYFQPIFLPAGG